MSKKTSLQINELRQTPTGGRHAGGSVLITGGAGFIGSNLCEFFLNSGYEVICLDNLSTGFKSNMDEFIDHPAFKFVEGDIRDIDVCRQVTKGVDYVLHEAALGSVPRSINDPITSNAVNVGGFLNMLVAARDAGVKRFIYAASSSTYGDSQELPKVEEKIGKPLSPYAVTKYVNELYADVFSKIYGMECIGLRYFNVFGRRQSPEGAYAAVIPLFVKSLIRHQRPVINGNGEYSRDFTYIENVILANYLAIMASNHDALNQVYNVAFGERTTLNQLFEYIRDGLAKFDPAIGGIAPVYGPFRAGDIPHSLASVEKAKVLLGYKPVFSVKAGLERALEWYWNNLQ